MIGEDGILKELELAGFQYLGGPVRISSKFVKSSALYWYNLNAYFIFKSYSMISSGLICKFRNRSIVQNWKGGNFILELVYIFSFGSFRIKFVVQSWFPPLNNARMKHIIFYVLSFTGRWWEEDRAETWVSDGAWWECILLFILFSIFYTENLLIDLFTALLSYYLISKISFPLQFWI